jgi:hypothetical protein
LVRRNPWLRQYYERLRAAGKPGKVAIIAAMRKLLVAVLSVATHRRPFVPIIAGANHKKRLTDSTVLLAVPNDMLNERATDFAELSR